MAAEFRLTMLSLQIARAGFVAAELQILCYVKMLAFRCYPPRS
jgi:hypothetical protein